jgi:hypothetical protein
VNLDANKYINNLPDPTFLVFPLIDVASHDIGTIHPIKYTFCRALCCRNLSTIQIAMAPPFSPYLHSKLYFLEVIDLFNQWKETGDNKTDGKIVPLFCFSTRIVKYRRRERLKVPDMMRMI